MVSRILQEEAYTGTLICHKSERNKINKTFRYTDPEEQYRHENFLPAIIPKELWEEVQFLLEQRKKQNVRAAPDQRIHRYSGLILCGDCGRSFIGKRIKLKAGDRVEYICSTYHRYGKEHCSAHAIREEFLDEVLKQEFQNHTDSYENGVLTGSEIEELIGRHKTQTALFIDYLRRQGVAVLSVTENLNTLVDEDNLIIGVRGLMNDYYAKDIGNKIRHGYREKQKVGLVITPPFGYWKDRNTNCIHQHPEAAETVRLIYDYYLQGVGQKEIARRLNRLGRKTPAQLRAERYGREFYASRKDQSGQYVWTYVSVKNVPTEEGYTGVLINHRTETRNGKVTHVPTEYWQRHEDFYPAIITKEEWRQAQAILKQKAKPAFENRPAHRYSGLLTCGNCGQPFVPMIRYWNGSQRVEYVCKGYHGHCKYSDP